VPRADIKGIPAGSPLRAVIEAIRTGGHSRLVVFRETLDDIVGVIHIRDLLPYWGDGDTFSLEETMRPILVVPPSMRVIDLLLEMRATRNHLAVVVDEFGGTDGLVTIEDLVQEIVGEVQDEHDRVGRPRLTRNPDDSIDVDGRLYLEELEKELGFELLEEEDRDEADTVGGLIFTLLDRVPNRGEKVRHPSGVEFEILDADPRRIKRIRVRPTEASAGDVAEQQTG
jgi:CBS domain containing-hemolysin-like protein